MAASLGIIGSLYDQDMAGAGWIVKSSVNNYCYMTGISRNSFNVFDATDPFNLKQVGQLIDSENLTTPEGMVESADGRYVFVASQTNLAVIDVSNPALPFVAAIYTQAGMNAVTIRRSGNAVFMFGGTPGSTVYAVSVANPLAPAPLGSYAGNIGFGVIVGNYLYGLTKSSGATLKIISIADPTNMTLVGSLNVSAHSATLEAVAVHGSYAYISGVATPSLIVVDVSVPATPSYVKSVSLAYTPWVLMHNGAGLLFVDAVIATAIYAYDIVSDPTTPAQTATVADATRLNGVDDLFWGVDGYLYSTSNTAQRINVLEYLPSDTGVVCVANKSGNYSDTTLWSDTGGTALNRIPIAGDEVRTSTFTVAIDVARVPATSGRLKSFNAKNAAGALTSGHFTVDTDAVPAVTIVSKRILAGTVPLIVLAGSGAFTLTGWGTGGTAANAYLVKSIVGAQTINLVGIFEGGSAAGAYAAYVTDAGDGAAVNHNGTLVAGTCAAAFITSNGGGTDPLHTFGGARGTLNIPACLLTCGGGCLFTGFVKGGLYTTAVTPTAAIMAATGQTGPFFAYFSGVVMATIDTIPIAGGQVPTPGLGNAVVVSSSFGSGFTTGVSFPLQSAAYVQAADVAAVTPATVLYGTTINFGASSVNGTHHAPANADVRHGTANGVSPAAGTAYIPAASNVRYGTSVDATTGTCHVPTAAQTLYGVSVDVSDTGTVALPNTDGSTPDASLVKSTAHFGAGNATAGTLDTASIATEAASAQHTIDAEFLTTHANEIISADTFILSEFGIAGLAAGGGGGGSSNNPYLLIP